MKNIHVIILGILVVFLVIISGAATLKSTGKFRFKRNTGEMIAKLTTENHFTKVTELSEVNGDNLFIIDIRDPGSFSVSNIPNSMNIPYERLLDNGFRKIFRDGKKKILYCDDGRLSDSAWLILSQFGYENLAVLEGGFSAWNKYSAHQTGFIPKDAEDEAVKFSIPDLNGDSTKIN